MPTTLANPGDSIAQVRFKEPYVSQGLNKKLFGLVGSGVVRGGKLQTTGAGFGINIVPDSVEGDSIYSYQDVNDLQFTVRQDGIVSLDLTALAGQTVYICLFVGYTIGSTTVVNWRAYTQAELFTAPVAEAPFVVILGRVVVPGVGPIPAANITPTARRMAWDDRAPDSWHQIIKNGGFERAFAAGFSSFFGIEGWTGTGFGTPNYRISTTAPYEGTREFQLEQPAPGVVNNRLLIHDRRVRVSAGMYVRGRLRMRGNAWPGIAVGGHQGMALLFYDNDMTLLSTVWIEDNTLSGSFAYTLVDGVVEVPTGAVWMRPHVGINNNGASLAAGSIYFDDVKCWVEGIHPIDDVFEQAHLGDTQAFDSLALNPGGGFDSNAPTTMAEFLQRTALMVKASQLAGPPVIEQVFRLMRGQGLWRDVLLNGQIEFSGFTGTDQSEIPRLVMGDTTGDRRVLIYEGTLSGITERCRLYLTRFEDITSAGTAIGFEFTINARWDVADALWYADNTSGAAQKPQKFSFCNTIFGVFEMNMSSSVAAGWLDQLTSIPVDSPRGWDYANMMLGGAGIGGVPFSPGGYEVGAGKMLLENGSLHFYRPSTTESNPSPTSTTAKNTLYAKNICKSWGKSNTGVAFPTLMTVVGGYNFAQVRQLAGGSHIIEVTTGVGIDDAVGFASTNTLGYSFAYVQVSPTVHYFAMFDTATGLAVDVAGLVATFNFILFGTQT